MSDPSLEQSIAPRYYQTRFIKANVANVPFLVQKLEIKILPCVFAFIDGLVKDRCGFSSPYMQLSIHRPADILFAQDHRVRRDRRDGHGSLYDSGA